MDMLTPFGFELHQAIDGQDCIEQTLDWKPNLILMDSKMPIVDGLEACGRIRSNADIKDIKIIAISANAYDYHRQRCLDAGANDFLAKPLQLDQLLQMIAQYTGLEPVYETSKTASFPKSNEFDQECSFPPKAALERLLILAEQGDIQAVREQVDGLKQMDHSYLVFLEELNNLTDDFQINKICHLLKQAISKEGENR